MENPKSQKAAKMFRHQHGIEAHNRYASSLNGAQHNEWGVGNIQPAVHATQEDAGQAMNGQQVDDEGVASPRRHLEQSHTAVTRHAKHFHITKRQGRFCFDVCPAVRGCGHVPKQKAIWSLHK